MQKGLDERPEGPLTHETTLDHIGPRVGLYLLVQGPYDMSHTMVSNGRAHKSSSHGYPSQEENTPCPSTHPLGPRSFSSFRCLLSVLWGFGPFGRRLSKLDQVGVLLLRARTVDVGLM